MPISEQSRLAESISRIAALTRDFATIIDLQRKDDPVTLDIAELTIRVSAGGRRDYLWEMGATEQPGSVVPHLRPAEPGLLSRTVAWGFKP